MDDNRNHDSGSYNRKLNVENQKVLLFLDNAPSHPETLQGKLTQNTTSQLQPCYASIIRNFKFKYRKQLLKHFKDR